MNVLVSACLLGVGCRFDGKSKPNDDVIKLKDKYNLIPFCPEMYGGLQTPRMPSEIVGNKVISKDGNDVTMQYEKGGREAVRIAKMFNCKYAIMKEKSPSCGNGKIYNGLFDGGLVDGDGITVRMLKENGIIVFGEGDICKMGYFPDFV